MGKTEKLTLEITNIDKCDKLALIYMFKIMNFCGKLGADIDIIFPSFGDGGFYPQIKFDGKDIKDFDKDREIFNSDENLFIYGTFRNCIPDYANLNCRAAYISPYAVSRFLNKEIIISEDGIVQYAPKGSKYKFMDKIETFQSDSVKAETNE